MIYRLEVRNADKFPRIKYVQYLRKDELQSKVEQLAICNSSEKIQTRIRKVK